MYMYLYTYIHLLYTPGRKWKRPYLPKQLTLFVFVNGCKEYESVFNVAKIKRFAWKCA